MLNFKRLPREQIDGLVIIALGLVLLFGAALVGHSGIPAWVLITLMVVMALAVISLRRIRVTARKAYGPFTGKARLWALIIAGQLLVACAAYIYADVCILTKTFTGYDLNLLFWAIMIFIESSGLMAFRLGREIR